MSRDATYDRLFEPVRIGPKVCKNRFFQVPQCTGAGWRAPGANAAHREVKAEGGWAVLCTEACSVHPEADQTVSTVQTIWDEGDVVNHRHMVDAVHKWGALAGIELFHAGGLSDNLGTRYAQTALHQYQAPWMPYVYGFAADEAELARVVTMHVEAAKRALQAGFDIIYVHGTHGTLPVQALSRHRNRRTDRYGGSFPNRARLWLEILAGLKAAVGDRCAIANRFSIDQLEGESGVEAEDEGLAFVELVTKEGLVDLWDVNIGGIEEWGEDAAPSRFQATGHQSPWTKLVKPLVDVPVVGVGRYTDPDVMLKVVRDGRFDLIGCARPSIADPWLPRKLMEGRADDICECIGCNQCISRFEHGGTIVCTQNPTALEEYRRGWHPERFAPAASTGPIAVVGAGLAGLECARVLGRRGYDVQLIEASPDLGGHLKDVIRLPGLAEWGRAIDWRKGQLAKLPSVEVLRGVGVATADDLLELGAARIIVATGAYWTGDGTGPLAIDPIPGIDAATAQFLTPEQVMAGKPVGTRVAILDSDGYFMATSLAQMLAERGHGVTIVTPFEKVAPYTDWTLEGPNLRRMLRAHGIAERTAQWVDAATFDAEITLSVFDVYRDGWRRADGPGGAPRTQSQAADPLICDSVVLCTSRRSDTTLFDGLRARRGEWADRGIVGVHRAGDCLAPRYLADVVFDGHRIGREIDSPDPERPLSIIRERRIWGQPAYPQAGQPVL